MPEDAPTRKKLVLDANILIRAVLGRKAFGLIHTFATNTDFITARVAFDDARRYLPSLLEKRRAPADKVALALETLAGLHLYVTAVPEAAYQQLESEARQRLRNRDEDDWHYLALALLLNCPIWTEDQDFFGSGVAVWTSDRVHVYLES